MSTDDANRGQIFASYSTDDSQLVHAICRELVLHGLSIWIDQNEIKPGEDIVERLNRGLTESKLFMAFIGRTYFRNGRYTSAEFGAAFHKARSAESWRIIAIKLEPEVELPPLLASRLFIKHTTVSDTTRQILQAVGKAEAWEGPVFHSSTGVNERSWPGGEVDFADIGDLDLEIVVSSFLDAAPRLLQKTDPIVFFDVRHPRKRHLELSLLRAVVENEGIILTLRDLLERINIQRRFVSSFSRQIDEGLLGKFEVATEIALERVENKLASARAELRRQVA
jgi:hypothetical protein